MERREFIKSALVTGVSSGPAFAAEGQKKPVDVRPMYYQLRRYTLRTGPQLSLAQTYFEKALIPSLNRLQMAPIGAFRLDVGPQTPTYYVLIPSTSVDALVTLDTRLGNDPEYLKAAVGFRDAPAEAPAFLRTERSLLSAFSAWPSIVPPKRGKRIFQLRTYESPSQVAHSQKIRMFNEAEIGIFVRAGLNPVFFGDTLVGERMPSLTYMLAFADVSELNERWSVFGSDPAWKELSHRPGNTDPEIVSSISNLYLSPLSCSQI